MAIRKTSQIGEKVIRSRARNVPVASNVRVQKVITDLIDSMHHDGLVGMAAPQIGVGLRIFVSQPRETRFRKKTLKIESPLVFINPHIVTHSKQRVNGYEGCGSVANATLFGIVKRYHSIVITTLDRNGKKFTLRATGLLARIIQHEIDHLDGIVFLDRLTTTRSLLDLESYLKLKER